MKTLTGNTRYRTHKPLFGKPLMVLQLEWNVGRHYDGVNADTPAYTVWEDASVEDMSVNIPGPKPGNEGIS